MEVQSTDPLELHSLPSDPRVMALRLLGMTAAEMKEIDSNITGNRNNISGLKMNIDNLVNEFNQNLVPQQVTPVTDTQTTSSPIQAPLGNIVTPQVQQHVQSAPVEQATNTVTYDPNQMEFDFYKKITPEELQDQLKTINRNIKNLEIKLDSIIELIEQKKN
jgi:hypothetical protein